MPTLQPVVQSRQIGAIDSDGSAVITLASFIQNGTDSVFSSGLNYCCLSQVYNFDRGQCPEDPPPPPTPDAQTACAVQPDIEEYCQNIAAHWCVR
jgi:hypothetical protein